MSNITNRADMERKHKDLAEKAIECQDACNPRPVARLLVEAICNACDLKQSTDGAANDPVVYLLMDKLISMRLHNDTNISSYHNAYEACKQLAGTDA